MSFIDHNAPHTGRALHHDHQARPELRLFTLAEVAERIGDDAAGPRAPVLHARRHVIVQAMQVPVQVLSRC